MKKLMNILNQHNVEEHELAEMIYAYLIEHCCDEPLLNVITKEYFESGE